MATPTLGAPRRSYRLVLPVTALVICLILLAIGGVALWLYSAARASLPQLNGSVSTAVSAPVTVIRDQQGVPHITAQNMDDLVFAQGYVTAQDRLWQMDMTRRYIAGELAEVLGPEYVKNDRYQRTLGMRRVAQRAAASVNATDRKLLDAYARGVNTFIESHRRSLPVEFRVLGYSPRPWAIEDTFLIACMFNEMLNLFYVEDMLARERVLARVPADLGADLFPNTSRHDHPPGEDTGAADRQLSKVDGKTTIPGAAVMAGLQNVTRIARAEAIDYGPAITDAFVPGSNNWVISGAHTVTGKPLLSNDMHLQHHIPNVWYEVHLTSGDLDVAGVTAPGLPLVLVGHNRRIAWGFTNLGPAVTDLYVETFNSSGQYETPQGYKDAEHRHELIKVKGKPDVALDVTSTRHGPLVTSLLPGETRPLALKWTLWDPELLTATFEAVRGFDLAQNWSDFRRAAAHFGGPGQNMVYADVDGHIGYQATGWVPTRAAGDASKPVPGGLGEFEWTGYIPFEKMPTAFDPPSGIIGTANGRATPNGYSYFISGEWMSPYRTDRIYQVLHENKKFSADDMLALQTDVCSQFDRFLAQQFAAAIEHTPSASERVRRAGEIMRQWDGRVTVDAVGPTITVAARRELQRMLLEPLLGQAQKDDPNSGWHQYRWQNSSVWLENVLSERPQRWLPKAFNSWDTLLTSAVEQAVTGKQGDVATWKWGDSHPVYLQHPIFGQVPVLNRWTGPGRVPQSGDGTTVKQVGLEFGPSERLTVDFSNLDQSRLNIVSGESGNLLSPYYMDQWQAWYQGTSFVLPFSSEAVQRAKAHELRLESNWLTKP